MQLVYDSENRPTGKDTKGITHLFSIPPVSTTNGESTSEKQEKTGEYRS